MQTDSTRSITTSVVLVRAGRHKSSPGSELSSQPNFCSVALAITPALSKLREANERERGWHLHILLRRHRVQARADPKLPFVLIKNIRQGMSVPVHRGVCELVLGTSATSPRTDPMQQQPSTMPRRLGLQRQLIILQALRVKKEKNLQKPIPLKPLQRQVIGL